MPIQVIAAILLSGSTLVAPPAYPPSPKGTVVDDYFGTKVADPYRWLEDDNSAETKAWVDAQNKVAFGYLEGIPQREAITQRLTKLWNYEKFGAPAKEGGQYFYSRNDGLQPQSVLFVTGSLTGEPRVLLDPNTLRADGTVALAGTRPSEDAKLLAYGIADAGSDWNTWKVRDVQSGKDLADELKWVKFSGASWTKDNKGFFYNRYDAPAEGKVLTGVNEFPKVFYHRVGDKQEQDTLIYNRPDQGRWGFAADVTDDGKWLVMTVSQGTDPKNRFFYRAMNADALAPKPSAADAEIAKAEGAIGQARKLLAGFKPDAPAAARKAVEDGLLQAEQARADLVKANSNTAHGFVELLNTADASYNFVDNNGSLFWFLTDLDAPRGRLIGIDVTKPDRANWKEVIPQAAGTLRSVTVVGEHLIANYLKDAASEVKVFDLDGKLVRNVELPGLGTAAGFGGKRKDPETFYTFTSYTMPPAIFRYDVNTGASTVWKEAKVDFDPKSYESKQVFYSSKDGTKVPMFIVHRKGLTLDGDNPTLLYGYGGFNIPMTPSFSPSNIVWMDMGGVYAVDCIRGGGEYGEAWHEAGTKLKKQNVFDDFIAAGEWLVSHKYTKPARLAIQGGSNGGLLVGACMTQRPDLFGAAIPQVGVMDMLRFHLFTIGWGWKPDYGSSENPEQFKALNAFSPYHALLRSESGVKYPSTLVCTGDHDDRVVPGHSFKFAAALQAAHKGDNPVLIRIEVRAGHGAGTPTAKRIQLAADIFAFLVKELKMDPKM